MRRSSLVVTDAGRPACDALGVRSPQALLALEGGTEVARSRTRRTVRLDSPAGAAYLKRYDVPSWRHLVRGLLRWTWLGPSKAAREFHNGARLRAGGWQTPEVWAVAEVRRWFGNHRFR